MAHRVRGAHQRHQAPTGLSRCRYRGTTGMKRWVGLGIIAENLMSMGNTMAKQAKEANKSGP